MKNIFLVLVLLSFGCGLGFAQTGDKTTETSSQASRQNDEQAYGHNWGWIGLLGLAGLAGLRGRKSEDVRRLESTGVNVKTVKTA
jgi:MYXO-CTERM domain-containing protein